MNGRLMTSKIAAHVPNLFDRARFGPTVVFVDSGVEAAAQNPTAVMVDLDRCDDPQEFRLDGTVVIGFGSHVDAAAHQRARDLGYDLVLPRSQFFRRLPDLLTQYDVTLPDVILPDVIPPDVILVDPDESDS